MSLSSLAARPCPISILMSRRRRRGCCRPRPSWPVSRTISPTRLPSRSPSRSPTRSLIRFRLRLDPTNRLGHHARIHLQLNASRRAQHVGRRTLQRLAKLSPDKADHERAADSVSHLVPVHHDRATTQEPVLVAPGTDPLGQPLKNPGGFTRATRLCRAGFGLHHAPPRGRLRVRIALLTATHYPGRESLALRCLGAWRGGTSRVRSVVGTWSGRAAGDGRE